MLQAIEKTGHLQKPQLIIVLTDLREVCPQAADEDTGAVCHWVLCPGRVKAH